MAEGRLCQWKGDKMFHFTGLHGMKPFHFGVFSRWHAIPWRCKTRAAKGAVKWPGLEGEEGDIKDISSKTTRYEKRNKVGARAATQTINLSGINHAGRSVLAGFTCVRCVVGEQPYVYLRLFVVLI